MKMTSFKKALSLVFCIVLIAAMALFTTACNDNTTTDDSAIEASTAQTVEETPVKTVGEGKTEFDFSVVDKDGNETKFLIKTDKKTVGEALLELGLIDGEQGDYGLYVKEVNGEIVDYDTDGKYWAFYENGEYAQAGVDSTEIKQGASYSFKVE